MTEEHTSIGESAWGGKPVSAEPQKTEIPLSSDMPPLSGKSVTSLPKEHIFDRVPPPATNTNPTPEIPVDGYYTKYKEMMERRMAADGKVPASVESTSDQPVYYSLPNEATEVAPNPELQKVSKETVLAQVKGGTPAALYDSTIIPLVQNGLAKLDFFPAGGGVMEIVAISTKDGKPLRAVGFARDNGSNTVN